jgi:uncharacterized protein
MARRSTEKTKSRSPRDASSLDERYREETGEKSESPPRPPERQTFGNTPETWMVVSVDESGRQAVLKKLAPGGDSTLRVEDLATALRTGYLIEHGIDADSIAQILARALAAPDSVLTCNQVVARATPPVAGKDGRIEFASDQGLDEEAVKTSSQTHIALKESTLEEVFASNARGVLVAPGQHLARIYPETQGEAGSDIYGNELLKPGAPPPLVAGPHIAQTHDALVAETYGYIGIAGNKLTIAPPIWISSDAMRAAYIRFELLTPAPAPKTEWFAEALEKSGVVYGADDEAIAKLCRTPLASERRKALTIARGQKAIAGENAHVEYTFDPEKRAGKIMPDGSIDFRERNIVIGVAADQLLGEVKAATKGQMGKNLFGEEQATTDGSDHVFKAGENVRAEGDPPRAFYAQTEGNAHVAGDTVHVKPVFVVSGDVNYETGNIDTPMDVQINGSVRSGFAVKAGGSIAIGGTVEANVTLTAHGDVVVSQGIIGEDTTVTARGILSLGNIQTKFIQNASVLSKGDIEVGSYIFNSQVRSGGVITVHSGGGKRGGSIVGGEVFAASAIKARLCGSPSTAGTTVGISPDPALGIKLAKLEKVLIFCDSTMPRLLRTLGLQTVDAQRLKDMLRRAPKARKRTLAEIIQKLYDVSEARDKALAEKKSIEEQNESILAEATIEIEGTLFSGVTIQMGQEQWVAEDQFKRTCFYRGEEGIENRPL